MKKYYLPASVGLVERVQLVQHDGVGENKLYDVLSQGASKLPEIKDLDFCTLLNKRELFGNF